MCLVTSGYDNACAVDLEGENIGGGGAELDWLATCKMNLVKNCHINTSEHFY